MARYYFHLVSQHEVILDEDGVEVADLAAAGAEALKAIEELRRESPSAATGWEGWWLEVTDASGAVAFSITSTIRSDSSGLDCRFARWCLLRV